MKKKQKVNLNNDTNFSHLSHSISTRVPYTNNTVYGACTVHTLKENHSLALALALQQVPFAIRERTLVRDLGKECVCLCECGG